MGRPAKTDHTTEFGDFQTPLNLAYAATEVLRRHGLCPRSILEPTCGQGAFVRAAATTFPHAALIVGIDINQQHLDVAQTALHSSDHRVELRQGDFYALDGQSLVTEVNAPWLILGNPPWVTNASLSVIGKDNLPKKSNFHERSGIEAITGKSNFDVSEWMILRCLTWVQESSGVVAMLCKTSVARKVLLQTWKNKMPPRSAYLYKIDALHWFGAAVDACFIVIDVEPANQVQIPTCDIFDGLDSEHPTQTISYVDGYIVSDLTTYAKHRSLLGRPEDQFVWRSGIKHDCAKVMELRTTSIGYQNGLGERVVLEDAMVFPLLKSSDIGNGRIDCRGAMVVTQKAVGQETASIKTTAPLTWAYLQRHAMLFEKRGSTIYKGKHAFSIFGVGPYSFAPWKVAISGFYKHLQFVKVGPVDGRPVVFDDTVYFLPCQSEEEAHFIIALFCSQPAQELLNAMIHWDEKRPISADILRRLSVRRLALHLGREQDYRRFANGDMALIQHANSVRASN